MKTYWLSFCDGSRPKGQQFLGVAVIDVTDDEAREMRTILADRFPAALEGAEWIGAAMRKAHALQCNPGGEVAAIEMPAEWPDFTTCPRGELLTAARLQELELV